MFRYLLTALPGLVCAFGSCAALADLPSLMPDRAASAKASRGAPQRSPAPVPGGLAALQRGLSATFGAVHCRLGEEGVAADFRYRGAAARAVIGYEGERRLELDWRMSGRNVKFAIAATEDDGYLIRMIRSF